MTKVIAVMIQFVSESFGCGFKYGNVLSSEGPWYL